MIMGLTNSEYHSEDIERQGIGVTSEETPSCLTSEAVDSTPDASGLAEGIYAQGRGEYQATVLPAYEQVQNVDSITTSTNIVRTAESEAGYPSRTLSNKVSGDEILPVYSRHNDPTASWDSNVIQLALQDAAVRKSSGGSACHILQASGAETKDYECHRTIPQSSTVASTSLSRNAAVDNDPSTLDHLTNDQNRFLDAYFRVIRRGDDDLLYRILESGLVDANTRNPSFTIGTMTCPSPLMAAVKAGQRSTMLLLLENGALVNGWDVVQVHRLKSLWGRAKASRIMRTPLQVAAQDGNLPLVKILMEVYHADDSLISPTDGQTALRLAADAGHRHIVDYLPLRRGGFGLRARAKWRSAASKIHKNISHIGEMLQCIWHLLRLGITDVIKPVCKMTWQALKKLPETLPRILRKLLFVARRIPKVLVDVAKEMWRGLVKCVKATPRFCLEIAKVCWKGVCQLWRAVEYAIGRGMSLIHIAVVAICTFFHDLTWSNLWHSLEDLLVAIFIHLPTTCWRIIKMSWTKLVTIVVGIFGCLGEAIYCLGWIMWQMLIFFPKRLFALLVAMGGLVGHVFHEIVIWWNPKNVRF